MSFKINSLQVGSGDIKQIFLHGIFGKGSNWLAIAKALSDQVTSLLIDVPNHGRSDWTEHFDYDLWTYLIHDHVINQPGFEENYQVLGHSMGGKLAMKLALSYPNEVKKLAVVDISPIAEPPSHIFAELLKALNSLDLTRIKSRAEADQILKTSIPDDAIRWFLLQNLHHNLDKQPTWSWLMNIEMITRELDKLGSWSTAPSALYNGPVIWVKGQNSDYVKPEHLPIMHKLFPKTLQVNIKDAGHWVHSEHPEAMISTLRKFNSKDH